MLLRIKESPGSGPSCGENALIFRLEGQLGLGAGSKRRKMISVRSIYLTNFLLHDAVALALMCNAGITIPMRLLS